MKIWIDLTNSPHILFFKPFIEKWESEGCKIIITCRDLANTIDLIEAEKWKYSIVGRHAGKNKLKKIVNCLIRILKLKIFLSKQKPEVSISHSSFECSAASWLLGVPSIYLNDNEHAKANIIPFIFSKKILLPESLMDFKKGFLKNKKKITYYRGVKEGIYLSKRIINLQIREPSIIYIRLEPSTAQYYNSKLNIYDDLIKNLEKKYPIVILPRDKNQYEHYKKLNLRRTEVLESVIALEDIFKNCLLFIGAGGSMTREMAVLGLPTISIYRSTLLMVDHYLIDKKFMIHDINPTIELLENYLKNYNSSDNSTLINLGDESFNLINDLIKAYAK